MADGEGQVAGRLEVLVEANLRGFARELKRKVEQAAAGVDAEVGVEVDDTGLRQKLKAAVEKASAGLSANVNVDVDEEAARGRIRSALSNIAARFGRDTTIDLKTSVSKEGVAGSVAASVGEAERMAESRPIRVPLRAKAGLWLDVLKEKFKAQRAAGTPPIEVPVEPKMPSGGGGSMRWLIRGGLIAGIASLIQPAVGAIEQAIGGLVAMVGAAAPAVGIIAGIGPALASGIQAGVGLTTAMGGVGEAFKVAAEQAQALAAGQKLTKEQARELRAAMEDLSPSARKFITNTIGLRDEWIDLRKTVQEPLFEPLARRIRPVADRLLPVLEKGLEGTADVFGGLIDKTGAWMDTRFFARDFDHIMTTNNGLLADGADALLNIGKGMTDFLVAARPFTQRMGDVVQSAGEWFRMSMARGRRSGGIADFLQRAGDEAARLWRITQNLGSGIASVFRAGQRSGDRLLDSFEQWSEQWAEWAGGAGQARMRQWFNRVEPGFREIGRIVRDTGNALFKWAEDPGIVKMLRQIRTKMGPAINQLLEDLGKNLGPEVIESITQIAEALANLSDAHKPLVQVLKAINGLLRVLNRMMEAQPEITSALAEIAGAMLLLGTMKRVGKGLRALLGLGKSAKGVGTVAAEAGQAASTLSRAAGSGGRFAGMLSRIARSPLAKKAGWAGLALGTIDFVDQIKRAGTAVGDSMEGIDRTFTRTGESTQATVRQIKGQLQDSFVGKWAPDFNIDIDRLAADIARFGDQGKYLGRVQRMFKEKFGALDHLFGLVSPVHDSTSNKVDWMRQAVENIVEDVVAGKKRVTRAMRDFQRGKREWSRILMSPLKAPKGGPKKPSPLPFDVEDLARDGKRTGSIIDGVIRTVHRVGRSLDQAGRRGRDTGKQIAGGLKPVPPAARESGNAVDGMAKKVRGTRGIWDVVARGARQLGRGLTDAGREGKRGGQAIVDGAKPIPAAMNRAKNAGTQLGRGFEQVARNVRTQMNNAANGVGQGVTSMQNKVRSGGPGISGAMQSAMQALVTAVQNARGPASSAASSVANGVKSSVQNSSGGMSTIGSQMMSGLAAGITSAGFGAGGPIAAAAAVSVAVAAEVAKRAEVRSPSRVMERIGSFISQGLAEGILGRARDVERAGARLWKLLEAPEHLWQRVRVRVNKAAEEAKKAAEEDPEFKQKWQRLQNTAKFIRELKQQTRREFTVLERVAGRREEIGRRLEKANSKLQNLVSARASLRSSVTQGINEYGSVTSVVDANDGWATPTSVIASLGRRLGESRRFARGVKTLLNRGIGRRAYRQLLEAGVEGAGATVDALLEATPRQLRRIRELQGDIAGVGRRLGDESSGELYDAGVKAAKGLVKGLRSRQQELRKVARDTARTLVKELKDRLKIKSPSQVMAGVGTDTVAGLDEGIRRRQRLLLVRARGMADALAREATPSLHMPSGPADGRLDAAALHRATRDRRHELTTRRDPGLAPLVGQLHLHVGDRDDIPAGMQEVNRTLRVIRRGGAHAFRAAGTSA